MKLANKTFKEILLKSGFVSEADLEKAAKSAKEHKKSLADVLIFRSLITEQALGQLIAEHLGVAFISLRGRIIPTKVLEFIPEKLARSYRILPFEADDKKLHLAMEDPKNFETLEFAKRKVSLQIVPYYITANDLNRGLGQYKRGIKAEFKSIVLKNIAKAKGVAKQLSTAAEEIPVVKLLDTIIEFANDFQRMIRIYTASKLLVLRGYLARNIFRSAPYYIQL